MARPTAIISATAASIFCSGSCLAGYKVLAAPRCGRLRPRHVGVSEERSHGERLGLPAAARPRNRDRAADRRNRTGAPLVKAPYCSAT
jgi:hypothetical protein